MSIYRRTTTTVTRWVLMCSNECQCWTLLMPSQWHWTKKSFSENDEHRSMAFTDSNKRSTRVLCSERSFGCEKSTNIDFLSVDVVFSFASTASTSKLCILYYYSNWPNAVAMNLKTKSCWTSKFHLSGGSNMHKMFRPFVQWRLEFTETLTAVTQAWLSKFMQLIGV